MFAAVLCPSPTAILRGLGLLPPLLDAGYRPLLHTRLVTQATTQSHERLIQDANRIWGWVNRPETESLIRWWGEWIWPIGSEISPRNHDSEGKPKRGHRGTIQRGAASARSAPEEGEQRGDCRRPDCEALSHWALCGRLSFKRWRRHRTEQADP